MRITAACLDCISQLKTKGACPFLALRACLKVALILLRRGFIDEGEAALLWFRNCDYLLAPDAILGDVFLELGFRQPRPDYPVLA
jgi:hypothetical protein